jgi:hypothetical protein
MKKQFAPQPDLFTRILGINVFLQPLIAPFALWFSGWMPACGHLLASVVCMTILMNRVPSRHWRKTKIEATINITEAFFQKESAPADDDIVNDLRKMISGLEDWRTQPTATIDKWLSKHFVAVATTLPEVVWGECVFDVEGIDMTQPVNSPHPSMKVLLRFTLYFTNDSAAVAFKLQYGNSDIDFE